MNRGIREDRPEGTVTQAGIGLLFPVLLVLTVFSVGIYLSKPAK